MGPMSEIGKHAPATVTHRRQPSIGILRVFYRTRCGYREIVATANNTHTSFFGYTVLKLNQILFDLRPG